MKNDGPPNAEELTQFWNKAATATWAGGGPEATSDTRPGFKVLEYRDGDWLYQDSYSGFLRSWGQEVIWYENKPVWSQIYGGGMVQKHMDPELASNAFRFLKQAISKGKDGEFSPRGPSVETNGDFYYKCSWNGDVSRFNGYEQIYYRGSKVFEHDFLGGFLIR